MPAKSVDTATTIPAADPTIPTSIILRSKITPNFTIEVGSRVINSCTILKNVIEHTDNSGFIDVDMNQKQLEKFVDLHNHFDSPSDPKDPEFTTKIFDTFSGEEFKDFTFKADFLDSQRFLEAAGDYVLNRIEFDDVQKIIEYLELEDDYIPEERKAMEEHPLEFFANIKFTDESDGDNDDDIIDPTILEPEAIN
uniref:Uncharacterized protein n=1 Tax=Panagrolaimus sp. ES5 TaxID=591445 RepID=A0AC34G1M9_9BILA